MSGLKRSLLAKNGCRVFDCENPMEAEQIWERHKNEISLLVTDIVMPGGLSGRDLAEALCKDKPSLKVVYCSGYSEEMLGENAAIRLSLNFVAKPFDSQTLLRTVRACLDSGQPLGPTDTPQARML